MLFSERIRTLRAQQGMLQRTLADAIGVDVPMYSRYEHGERRPKREQVVKLARLLHTDANELVALWLAEDALGAIGHDKMSARASQLLLEVLDRSTHTSEPEQVSAPPAEAGTPVAEPAPAVDQTLRRAPVLDASQRTLLAQLPASNMPHYEQGDARLVMQRIEDESVDCIVTTVPYWSLRRYDTDGITAETAADFVDDVLRVMAECHRVIKPTGSLWLGVADTYHEHSLLALPWRLAIGMIDLQGWTLRNDVVLKSRPNNSDNTHSHLRNTHETVFHFTKQPTDFYYNADELRRVFSLVTRRGSDKGPMPADVWDIALPKSPVERYYTAPEELCRLAIVGTCPPGGLVLDPYCGTGTTCKVAYDLDRRSVGIDINPDRLRLARARVEQKSLSLF